MYVIECIMKHMLTISMLINILILNIIFNNMHSITRSESISTNIEDIGKHILAISTVIEHMLIIRML